MLSAAAFPAVRAPSSERLSRAGRLLIAMILIVIIEGAFRKWLSSSFTLPLVLARDVLAAYAIFYSFSQGHLHRAKGVPIILLAWSCCVAMWGMVQLILGESNPSVFLLGLRFWLLYVWFACAVSASMTEHDFRMAVKFVLLALLLMGPLVVLQHFSSPGARINSEVDVDVSEVFTVVYGVVRTTGTFSFTVGFVTFLALCTPLVFLVLEAKKRNLRQRLIALFLLGAFAVQSIVSGSRTAIIFSGAMMTVYLIGSIFLAPGKRKVFALVAMILIVLILGLSLYVFQGAVEATQERFETAAEAEDVIHRIASFFIGESYIYDRFTWLGYGIGFGSNLAAYVTAGEKSFTLAETETGRLLLEGGLLGYLFMALKTFVVVVTITKSIFQAIRTRSMFPVLVWSTISLALFSWSYIGQLSINALFGVLLVFGLLTFKYPHFRYFP